MKIFDAHKKISLIHAASPLQLNLPVPGPYTGSTQAALALEEIGSKALLQALLNMGLAEENFAERIKKRYTRLFNELLRHLKAEGYVKEVDKKITIEESVQQDLNRFDFREALENLLSQHNTYAAHVALLTICIESLHEILTGKEKATDIIFPNGSLQNVAGLYKGNPQVDYFNELLADMVESTISPAIAHLTPGEKIRILEAGAGTGGTSAAIFKKISKYKDHLEYAYTDLSASFLLHAQENFKSIAPYLTTGIFDIEKPATEQSFSIGSYDIVIAANVVHATKDIATTLANLKSVLKKNGLLLLNELGEKQLFTTLTFGLLDGWWLYEDDELRLEGSPGLPRESWQAVMMECGFEEIQFSPDIQHLPQQLVIAKSDGRVVLKQNASATRTTVTKNPNVTNARPNKSALADRLTAIAIDTIRLPKENFDRSKQFSDLGFDSILGMSLIRNFNKELGISLAPTDIFNYPDIERMSAHIAETFQSQLQFQNNNSSPDVPVEKPTVTAKDRAAIPSQLPEIAIIGMSGQFGSANNIDEFWHALKDGKSLIRQVPPERWNIQEHYNADKNAVDKTYCKWGGFLNDIDKFDPMFFRISGREAETMDPQHRLFLEHCWKALEDAGIDASKLASKKCGVYAGATDGDYIRPFIHTTSEATSFWGMSGSILTSRISYYLNLKGPAVAIDTACSSSLVAMDMACKSLQLGETDLIISGGISISSTPEFYKLASRAYMLSPDGQCYTFDKRANGFVPGEGVGVVILKRLEDAEKDGDQIYGVIKGSLTNQDGTTNGITAPSVLSQRDLQKEVYDKFNIHPETIGYVEAHGTGTSLGDPIEIQALTESFRSFTNKTQYCSIGSVKTNVGHTLRAAGVAGIIKILLSFRHKQLLPTINYQQCNPLIDLVGSPFNIQDTLQDWQVSDGAIRRAAISSFGVSGTNAHMVLDEYIPKPIPKYTTASPVLILLSARNADRLMAHARNLQAFLRQHDEASIDDVAYTLQTGREAMRERLAIVADDRQAVIAQLASYIDGKKANIFTGRVATNSSDAENIDEQIEDAITNRQLHILAEQWVKGADIDWSLLYGMNKPRKMSLPTYPFARLSYWISGNEAASPEIKYQVQNVSDDAIDTIKKIDIDTGTDDLKDKAASKVRELIASLLKIDITDVDADAELGDYGFDSVLLIKFCNALNEYYEIELMPTVFYNYATVEKLAAFLADDHQQQLLKQHGAAAQVQQKTTAPVIKPVTHVIKSSPQIAIANTSEPVAIVGMSGRFPGSADLETFWNNLKENKDLITETPADRWDWKNYYGDPLAEKNKTRAKWGGFIDDIDKFDPLFFSISPREAELMDPQQRITLQAVYGALENAAISPSSIKGSSAGVFIGISGSDYTFLMNRQDDLCGQAQSLTGSARSVLSNRISYLLDLNGPSEPIDTACSSSLIAIHRAVESIRSGHCSMAIAGGVNALLSPELTLASSQAGMLSESGRCKSFDQSANGYVRSEGVGIIILKSLRKAEADGDIIYGVIRGTAENHGGKANTLTSPNSQAQKELLLKAYRSGGVDPRHVSYIEAHGTGTPLGDPIETEGLKLAFKELYKEQGLQLQQPHCALGSVKSNIGHLEAAAGVAGVIKVLLCMKHKMLPGNPQLQQPNAYLQLNDTPFYLQKETTEWNAATGSLRIAGVSSFGAGGSNAHVVLEEYVPALSAAYCSTISTIVVLSAKNKERLQEQAQNLKKYLNNNADSSLHDIAYTLQLGREEMEERLAIVAGNYDELQLQLSNYLQGKPDKYFAGNTKKEQAGIFIKGKAGNAYIREAINEKEPSSLAQLWVKGVNIDWNLLYPDQKPNRINLPVYPFAKERYWITVQDTQEPSLFKGFAKLHPLLHTNESDLEGQKFTSIYTGKESFLQDHQVLHEKILPGVAYLELAREAGERSMRQKVTQLKDISWLSPVRVNGSPETVHISLHSSDGEVTFEVHTGAQVHSQGTLSTQIQPAPAKQNISDIRSRLKNSISRKECYALFSDNGLQYGSSFQGIETLYYSDEEALSRIVLAKQHEGYVLPPGLLDSALQTCGMLHVTNTSSLVLPYSVSEVSFYNDLPDSMWCYVRKGRYKVDNTVVHYDIDLLNDAGEVLLQFKDFIALPINAGQSKKEEPEILHCPVWKRVKTAAIPMQSGVQDLFVTGKLDELPDGITHVYLRQGLYNVDNVSLQEGYRQRELQVFHSVQTLLHSAYATRPLHITALTCATQQVLSNDMVREAGSGIVGLMASLAKEQPSWKIRVIDVDNVENPAWKQAPYDADNTLMALRNGYLYKRILAPITLPQNKQSRFRQKGTYVILGGAGGIGKVTTAYLIKEYNAQVIWLGRSALNEKIEQSLSELAKNGVRPQYIQCDATSRQSMQQAYQHIKSNHSTINGLFHSAIVLHDMLLKNMSEEDFKKSFDPKSLASHHFVETFKEEPLDFICFYSSAQSQFNAAGQANYSAGCTYKDSYAHSIRQQWKLPAYIINWGYWGEAGVVASEDYKKRMELMGILGIGGKEGMQLLETILSNEPGQTAVLKLTAQAKQATVQIEQQKSITPIGEPSLLSATKPQLASYASDEVAMAALYNICRNGLLKVLLEMGLEERQADGLEIKLLRKVLGVQERHERLFAELIRALEEVNYLQKEGYKLIIPPAIRQQVTAFDLPLETKKLSEQSSEYSAHASLLQVCLESLTAVLKGEQKATDVLFPEGSMHRVSGIYKNNYQSDYFNQALALVIETSISQAIPLLKQGEKIRILEVGAGTGGTSALLFETLAPYSAHLEYIYTDVSKSFLLYAENNYRRVAPYLQTAIFNIEESPAQQGLLIGAYDVVIGANVVHATKDIATSLTNIKAVLKKNGLLILNELAQTELFTTLTFGLLDGWWLYEDEALRLQGSPGLSAQSWKTALAETGFEDIASHPQQQDIPQQIITATSNGYAHLVIASQNTGVKNISPTQKIKIQTSGENSQQAAEAYLKSVFSRIIKLDEQKIDTAASFQSLGIDSIVIGTLSKELSREFSSVSAATFFECNTVAELTQYLVSNHGDHFAPREETVVLAEANIAPKQLSRPAPVRPKPAPASDKSKPAERLQEIAIIGLSGRYPGARNNHEFWNNLRNGIDSITEIPKDRWDVSPYFDETRGKKGKISSKYGGFIDGVAEFDPLFFNISPREAETMDPQERLFLQTAWEAIEDAGYAANSLSQKARVRTGVYVGVMYEEYQLVGATPHNSSNAIALIGSPGSIANRVSYYCDFNGPSIAIDTMCSSSLTALHIACKDLQTGDADVAIAGGVNLSLHPNKYRLLSQNTFLSSRGRCESFGSEGEGFIPSEGVGAVLLKPLSKAEADGDRIYGVIKSTAVNHGGKTNGYTVPNPQAQGSVIKDAIERAGVRVQDISYIEAHGTGTSLGDPVEIAGLMRAFGTEEKQFCRIGSVKSNIGHCESAAGISGLAKVLLQLQHGELVPSLHSAQLNTNIDFTSSPFKVQQKLEAWQPSESGLRIAGISSFGAGGSNAHVIVSEYKAKAAAYSNISPAITILSAKNAERLREKAQNLQEYLSTNPDSKLYDIAYTLQLGREEMDERLAMVAGSCDELQFQLGNYLQGKPHKYFTGNIKKEKSELLLEGGAGQAYLRYAIEHSEAPSLAQLWVKGVHIDWNLLYPDQKPNKISLPTYPFARDRYWVSMQETQQPVTHNTVTLHPLLHVNSSTLNRQRFTSVYTGNEHFLRDHKVLDEKILPGVAYLELARAAAAQSIEGKITQLKDISWLSPIKVNGSPETVHINLQPSGEEVAFEVYTGKDKVHSQGRLGTQIQQAPAKKDISAIRARLTNSIGKKECYALFSEKGLQYGSSFQGIETLYYGDEEALSRIVLSKQHEGYVLPPGLLDNALQTCGVLHVNNTSGLVLPYSVSEINFYKELPEALWCYARKSERKVDKNVVHYDIDLLSESGEVLLQFKDFVALPLTTVNKPKKEQIEILYVPAWKRIKTPALPLQSGVQNLLVTGNCPVEVTNLFAAAITGTHISNIHELPQGITHIYLLQGLCACNDNSLQEGYKQRELQVFDCIQTLLKSKYVDKPLHITALTHSTQQVLNTDTVGEAGSGIIGLMASLAKEQPSWKIRVIDVDSIESFAWLPAPYDSDNTVMALRNNHLYQRSLVPVTLPETKPGRLRQQGTYVILGGAGGIGKVTTAYLIKEYKAQVIWLGRSGLNEKIEQSLNEMAQLGKRPLYIQCDATNKQSMQQAYQQIKSNHSTVHGLFHSAIVLHDMLLRNMNEDDFKMSFEPKSLASHHFVETFKEEPLDFVCFYSSAQSQFNAAGQANYSAGCTYKDSYAHSIRQKWKLPAYIINWGYWGETGVVASEDYKKRMRALGLDSISQTEGMEIIEQVLTNNKAQVVALKLL